jgi:hypothetical protein
MYEQLNDFSSDNIIGKYQQKINNIYRDLPIFNFPKKNIMSGKRL